MALNTEFPFPVKTEHKLSLSIMHTMAGLTGNHLSISWVYNTITKGMSNSMLFCMASHTGLYHISIFLKVPWP